MHHKALWPLIKKGNRGFRGFPIVTVAFYGPDDRRASKVAVGLIQQEDDDADVLERWSVDDHDIRDDAEIVGKILALLEERAAKTVAVEDRIIGCPHEEGVDYPLGGTCAKCPFWASRDRWTGEVKQ